MNRKWTPYGIWDKANRIFVRLPFRFREDAKAHIERMKRTGADVSRYLVLELPREIE